MQTVAYLRVSTNAQDLNAQKLAVLEFSRKENKEAIRFDGKQSLQSKVMTTLFALFAEVERDLISERTKAGLAATKASGNQLGRPKGSLGRSKLEGREHEIELLLSKGVSKAYIPKITDVSRSNWRHFIRTRQLESHA